MLDESQVKVGRSDYASLAAGFGYHESYLGRSSYGEYDPEATGQYAEEELDLPDGWKVLGSGVYRTAYLGPDGIVYKVCASGCEASNIHEHQRNWSLYREYPNRSNEPVTMALSELHYVDFGNTAVIAVEFIKGRYPDKEECDQGYLFTHDSHPGNSRVHYLFGNLVVIDLGS